MGDVHVRPAAWEDRVAVARLIAAMGSHEDVLEQAEPLLELGRLVSEPASRALVAEIDGRIVGYAELQARPSSLHGGVEGWLGALAVEAGLRRTGVGAALMQSVENEAGSLGCTEIVVESSSWRNAAHAFYRGIGFAQGTPAERFRRPLLPIADDALRFVGVAARAASRVAAVLAPWIGATTADKAADVVAEAAALETLGTLGLPILAEETGWSTTRRTDARWICLDAVDGSRNLRAGLAPWGFSAALVEGDQSIAGFVCNLATGRRWWAARGLGSSVDGRPARPRRVELVGVGSRPDAIADLPEWVERIRILGCTTVELCSVSDGSLGGFIGLGGVTVHPQDVAAASVILEEAGAVLVDSDGKPVSIRPDRETRLQVVAAPDREVALELLGAKISDAVSRFADRPSRRT